MARLLLLLPRRLLLVTLERLIRLLDLVHKSQRVNEAQRNRNRRKEMSPLRHFWIPSKFELEFTLPDSFRSGISALPPRSPASIHPAGFVGTIFPSFSFFPSRTTPAALEGASLTSFGYRKTRNCLVFMRFLRPCSVPYIFVDGFLCLPSDSQTAPFSVSGWERYFGPKNTFGPQDKSSLLAGCAPWGRRPAKTCLFPSPFQAFGNSVLSLLTVAAFF